MIMCSMWIRRKQQTEESTDWYFRFLLIKDRCSLATLFLDCGLSFELYMLPDTVK